MHINLIPEDMRIIVKHLRNAAKRTTDDAELSRLIPLIARFLREIELDDTKRAKQAEYRAEWAKRNRS